MTEYLLTLAVSFISAVVPVVNLEAYLGGLAVLADNGSILVTLAVGAVAAIGPVGVLSSCPSGCNGTPGSATPTLPPAAPRRSRARLLP